MKRFITSLLIILALSAAARAGSEIVGFFGQRGTSGGGCTGTIDASEGCPLPMLGM